MRNILVTGVAGFIGSNFVYEYLDNNPDDQIIGLDSLTYAGNLNNLKDLSEDLRKRFIFFMGDINDSQLVQKFMDAYSIEGIINFAAESHVDRSISDPQVFLKTNILGTQTLLDAAKKFWYENNEWQAGVKFLQVSTDEVYGSLGADGFFMESTPLNPHSPYSASKTSGDLIVQAYHDTYGMPMNITRCSNNYGPYQFPEKLIPLMISNAINHKSLPVYGDGKQIRDWLYVADHCKAIDLVFNKAKSGEVYNIGGHNERENIYIVGRIINSLASHLKDEKINENLIKHVEDRLGHDRRYGIDPAKIKRDLGWAPTIMFDEGIEMTIKWYLDNKEWVNDVLSGGYRKVVEF